MVYNYTKPRAPIGAMYRSPGPCYSLPSLVGDRDHDPRSTRGRAPAYLFGIKPARLSDSVGPGPSAYFPSSKVLRDGHEGSPRYSLYGRRRDLTPFETPGPGAYLPEKSAQERSLAYSIGNVLPSLAENTNPAPNTYSPPPLIGKTVTSNKPQAPAFTIYGRSKTGSFYEDYAKSPGPGAYLVVNPNQYKNKQPAYSLTSRNLKPGDTVTKPGPGAHQPEQVTIHLKRLPSYSFGIRHSDYEAPMLSMDP